MRDQQFYAGSANSVGVGVGVGVVGIMQKRYKS
jgi:hypothetical protein